MSRAIANRVKVQRLYEVFCDICGENPDSEFYRSRQEADDARAVHVAEHEQDGDTEPAGPWGDGRRWAEF